MNLLEQRKVRENKKRRPGCFTARGSGTGQAGRGSARKTPLQPPITVMELK